MTTSCISQERMAEFLSGDLSADEESIVGAHLQHCDACNRVARALSGAPVAREMFALAGHALESPAAGSLIELKARLRALEYVGESAETPLPSAESGAIADDGTKPNELPGPVREIHRLGKFEVLNELGAGGFGIVYLALDTVLQRNVAIKLPRSSLLADPDARNRFYREAQALARLDHPHILPVYEAGESEGTCYLAVAYCDGPTLEAWQRNQPRPIDPRIAVQIVHALAMAVEHAHQHGILHRDIKPANILLSMAPSGHELPFVPRLADFGLAKIADQGPTRTMSGVVLGTPQYLAPEQAAGMTDRIGPWTDVYGLGAVLYELLAGCSPIRGANSIDTLRRVLTDDPPPPSHFQSAVPPELDAVVMKCLAKSTTSRYATARELADDLEQLSASEPVKRSSHLVRKRNRAWLPSRNWLVAASILLAAGVSLAAVVAVSTTRRTLRTPIASNAAGAANVPETVSFGQQPLIPDAITKPDEPMSPTDAIEPAQDLNAAFTLVQTTHGSAPRAVVDDTVGSILVIDALDCGWWGGANNVHRFGNKNYLVARTSHNYFVFDLGAVKHKIVAAEVRLAVPGNNGYNSGDPYENYALFDVSTPLAELQGAGSRRSDIFHDLASGTLLGKEKFVNSDEGKVKGISLNADGIAALNVAAGELFGLGGALTTLDGTGGALFANSGEFSSTKQLVLTLASPTTKRHSLKLKRSQRLSVDLRQQRGRATLEIQDSSGMILARGIPGGNQNQRINRFVAPVAGAYTISVQAVDHTTYRLDVACDATLEIEPNDSQSTAQPIGIGAATRATRATSVIVPSHLTATEGNRGNGSPFNLAQHDLPSMRYQQIYSRTEFPQAGAITAIRFRRNRSEPKFTATGIDLKINLGYAATALATISSTFADNVGAGTTTVLNSDNLVLASIGDGAPNPLDIVIPLTTPFYYDPGQGDLLMEVLMRSSAATAQFDFSCRGEQTTTRRVISRHVNSATGAVDFSAPNPSFAGLVTGFDMAQEHAIESPDGLPSWSVLGTIASPPVVPSHVVNTSLDGANCYPFHLAKVELPGMRYQQLYSRSEFSQPETITAIRFRRNSSEPPFTTSGIDMKLNLGYAATTVSNPSLIFANNVGPESTTVLDTSNLTLSSTSTIAPLPFEIVISLQTPFYYNPSKGDLLMDVFMRNSSATARISSAGRAQPLVTRRVYATDVNATAGSTGANFLGLLITRFDTLPDEDWYSFEVTSDTPALRFEITAVNEGADQRLITLDPALELFDAKDSLVARHSELPGSSFRFIEFDPSAAGIYRLRVTAKNETAGAYVLTCTSWRQ